MLKTIFFYFQVLGCCIYPANKLSMVMNVKMPTMTIIVDILTFNDYAGKKFYNLGSISLLTLDKKGLSKQGTL